jgi:hypothetical protein
MNEKAVMKKPSLCALLAFALTLAQVGIAGAQASSSAKTQSGSTPDSTTEKVKVKVSKIGLSKDVTVAFRGGEERYGSIKSIEDDRFLIYEVDMKQLLEIRYSEVKKVQSGYGDSRDLYGRRIPPRKHLIGLAILAGVLLVPLIMVATAKD